MTRFIRILSAAVAAVIVVAAVMLVLGGTSVFAPALANHENGHDEVARGKIGDLENRVWRCENKIAPCERTGAQGAQGEPGQQGDQGPQGPQGAPGADGEFAGLVCQDGSGLIADANGDWVCALP